MDLVVAKAVMFRLRRSREQERVLAKLLVSKAQPGTSGTLDTTGHRQSRLAPPTSCLGDATLERPIFEAQSPLRHGGQRA